MLNFFHSYLYEAIVLGVLGMLLVIVSAINMNISSDVEHGSMDKVFCIKNRVLTELCDNPDITLQEGKKDMKDAKHTSQKAQTLVGLSFTAGVLLLVHSGILVAGILSAAK